METRPARYCETFKVRYSEVDLAGNLKIRSVLDYLQEVAGTHAERIGVGWEAMRAHNLAWVLSRLKIGFERVPMQGEMLTVETFPNGLDRIFALRQFVVRDGAGVVVARASSQWLAITLDRMRPTRLEQGHFDFPCVAAPCFFPALDKLPEGELAPLFDVEVRNSRIDLNGHMNNAEYAALVQDALYKLTAQPVRIAEMQINFLAAQKEGAKLSLAGWEKDGVFLVRATAAGGGECFQAGGRLCRV